MAGDKLIFGRWIVLLWLQLLFMGVLLLVCDFFLVLEGFWFSGVLSGFIVFLFDFC